MKRALRAPLVLIVGVIAASEVTGCAGKPSFSGFLSSYERLESGKPYARDFYYRSAEVSPFDYTTVIVDPVRAHLTKEAEGRDLNAEALAELTSYFDAGFRALAAEWFAITEAPGEGVARVRIAVTDVRPSKPLFDIVPHSKILGWNQGGATIEAEMVDSVTGEQILAIVDRGWGNRLRALPKFDTLDDARKVIDEWMRIFRTNLEELRRAEDSVVATAG